MQNLNRSFLILIVLVLFSPAVLAYDSTQPIELDADDLHLNNITGVLTYTGNVKLTQGEMILTADTLKIHTVERKVERIEAFGELAKLQDRRPDGRLVKAEAQALDYNVNNETIQLTGKGKIDQEGNTMSSESIFYDLKTSDLQAGNKEKKERVRMTLQPDNVNTGQ